MKVGVVGLGGLGHMAVKWAKAFGCEVRAAIPRTSLPSLHLLVRPPPPSPHSPARPPTPSKPLRHTHSEP